ncbi:hypothetical protein JT202_07745 [Helicobacter pylori]|nr:hypothetical protein [Helicobacter pylori]WRA69932.1 hypothetical protein FE350_02690 [Helicobacter pylori]
MHSKKNIKVIYELLILFLGIFELILIINDMSKTKNLEKDLKSNLQTIEMIAKLLNNHLGDMQLKKPKIKTLKKH